MFNKPVLAVEELCVGGVVNTKLVDLNFGSFFKSCISWVFVPNEPCLINLSSTNRITNKTLVSFSLYPISTTPIRAITKYLNILLLNFGRKP